MSFIGYAALGGVILIVLVIIALLTAISVPAGYAGVLLTAGNPDPNFKAPGLHFIIPVYQSIDNVETKILKTSVKISAASKDLQAVSGEIAVNHKINPSDVVTVYSTIGMDYSNRVIQPAIQESVKQVTAKYNADDLIQKREIIKNEIFSSVEKRLSQNKIQLVDLSIVDFDFSESFNNAIETKVTAVQKYQGELNNLKTIQVIANQTEAKAEGQQRANIAIAEGEKQQNILKAQGEAEAINIINEQLKNSPHYINWLQSQKWNGQLPNTLVANGDVAPFLSIAINQTKP